MKTIEASIQERGRMLNFCLFYNAILIRGVTVGAVAPGATGKGAQNSITKIFDN